MKLQCLVWRYSLHFVANNCNSLRSALVCCTPVLCYNLEISSDCEFAHMHGLMRWSSYGELAIVALHNWQNCKSCRQACSSLTSSVKDCSCISECLL